MAPTLRALFAGFTMAVAPLAGASEALAGRHACTACHQAERRAVGPSWKEIAAKYGDGSKTAEQLAATIRAGSTKAWGAIPMPPQPAVPAADAEAIARWILQR